MGWSETVERMRGVLLALEASDAAGKRLAPDEGIARWVELTRAVKKARRSLYMAGNGANAGLCSHMTADLGKNAGIRAQVFTDPSLATALANDMGVEHMFAEPLRLWVQPGDLLVALSSSGKSPNILAACRAAREAGASVVTLSAMGRENPLRGLGDVNLWIDGRTYGDAESGHAVLLHRWCDLMLEIPGIP